MLWWIGNLILLVAVVPIAVALLSRVLGALERIRKASDDILAGGVSRQSVGAGVKMGAEERLAPAVHQHGLTQHDGVHPLEPRRLLPASIAGPGRVRPMRASPACHTTHHTGLMPSAPI